MSDEFSPQRSGKDTAVTGWSTETKGLPMGRPLLNDSSLLPTFGADDGVDIDTVRFHLWAQSFIVGLAVFESGDGAGIFGPILVTYPDQISKSCLLLVHSVHLYISHQGQTGSLSFVLPGQVFCLYVF